MGRTMARMRQPDAQAQDQNGTRTRHSIASDRIEGKVAVFSRLPGALARAILVVLMIVTPSAMLPTIGSDAAQIVVLMAIFAAVFTIVEYTASSPSLVEFRSAPPFNRLRFGALFATVATLSIVFRDPDQASTITRFFQLIGDRIGGSIDFPYSPVRLMLVAMPADMTLPELERVRTAAGLSYLISLLSLAAFVLLLRLRGWPRHTGAFNVWVNLPTFDPTAGGDVVARLNRDSQINLILGFLLPFLVPAILKLTAAFIAPFSLGDPHTLIWTVTAWAFLPASLLMRGVALSRVAQMIYVQRKRAYAKAAADGLLPV
ncbi:MAG: hypothetical protein ACI9TZ_002057 [Yoonia sp.]